MNFIDKLEDTLSGLSDKLNDNQRNVGEIMLNLTSDLAVQLHQLGLEQDQEDFVYNKVELASKHLHELLNKGEPVQSALSNTISLLRVMAKEQHRIISENLTADNSVDEDITNDIELF